MKKHFTLLALLLSLSGCIKNDIPYPVILGVVSEFGVVGQKECTVNGETRVISLVLSDTVDIRNVVISKLVITPQDARCDLDSTLPVNLTTPLTFTISTYQDYKWRIEATQPIERDMQVDNQVGSANIDPNNKKVIVYVSKEQPLDQIVIEKLQLGPSHSTISPDPTTVTDFSGSQTFTVSYFDIVETWTVYVQTTLSNAVTGGVNPWACFVMVSGSILSGSDQACGFEYKPAAETQWQTLEVAPDGGKISAKIAGLTPETAYTVRAFQGTDKGAEVSFTTQAAPLVANLDMNGWSTTVGSEPGMTNGKTWVTPCAQGDVPFWASGNAGVAAVNKPSNTTSSDDAHQGKAARLETVTAPLVGMAAGNLFTGEFIFTSPPNELNSPRFGRPYTGRPTTLSFWYKYAPKPINVSKNDPALMGTMDKCIIYIYLGKWEKPLFSSELKGLKTPGVIAYGELVTDQAVATFTQHTITLEYVDQTSQPTEIIIVATSSIYGDKYAGGIGSTLFVDDFELGWQ